MSRSLVMPPRGRLVAGMAALVALCGAAWVNPPAASGPAAGEPQVGAGMPPAPSISVEPQVSQQLAALPSGAGGAPPQFGLAVVRWGLGTSLPQAQSVTAPTTTVGSGRPLYLAMTLDGGRAALDRLRNSGSLGIEVHWTRDNAGAGAPNLVTRLSVGQPGLAPTLAAEVARKGYFEWHSWARKDNLSPGRWTVSLTYPDGKPVLCGAQGAAQPCRFSLEVG